MTFNRDAAVAQMTQGSASAKVDWSISGIQVTGDKATYTSNFKFESTSVENSGAPGQKGKNHTISGTGVQRVQLSKLAGKWLYTNLDVVSSKIMMDGKPFNPQAQQASANKSAQ
jgi:hypothetical protein